MVDLQDVDRVYQDVLWLIEIRRGLSLFGEDAVR